MSFKSLFTYLIPKLFFKMIPSAKKCFISGLRSRVMSGGSYHRVTLGWYSYCGYFYRIFYCDAGSFCSIVDKVSIGGVAHTLGYVSADLFIQEEMLRRKFFLNAFQVGSKTE